MPTPAAALTDNSPITPATRSAGSRSRATAIVTGATPSPTPCIARPATSTPIESAKPAMMLPTNTTASAPRIASRRCGPSPSRPSTGAAMVPASSAAVSDHCAASSDTSSDCATSGSSGAPRLLTIEITRVTPTSTGTSPRAAAARSASVVIRHGAYAAGIRRGGPARLPDVRILVTTTGSAGHLPR